MKTPSTSQIDKGLKALKKGSSPKANKIKFHTTPVKPLRQKQQEQVKLSTPSSSSSKAKQDLTAVLQKLQGSDSSSSSKASKDSVYEKIFHAKSLGARNGVDFVIGYNGLCKAFEQHSAEYPRLLIVAVASDGRADLIQMLVQYASVKSIPFVVLPKCSAALANAFEIKRAFCFGLRSISNDRADVAESSGSVSDHRDAGMDQLREYLFSLKRD